MVVYFQYHFTIILAFTLLPSLIFNALLSLHLFSIFFLLSPLSLLSLPMFSILHSLLSFYFLAGCVGLWPRQWARWLRHVPRLHEVDWTGTLYHSACVCHWPRSRHHHHYSARHISLCQWVVSSPLKPEGGVYCPYVRPSVSAKHLHVSLVSGYSLEILH